jgi:apolipoprotein N-acyltransferase
MIRAPHLLSAAVVGLALGTAAWHPWLWWLVFPGLFGLLALTEAEQSLARCAQYVFLVFVIKAAGGAIGIWYVYPFDWLGITNPVVQLTALTIYWLAGATAVAVGATLTILLARWLTRNKSAIRRAMLFPPVLVAAEIAGSFTASLFYWGPGSGPHLHYAMDYVGYAFGHVLPLASMAQFGGVYLLSALAASLASLAYFGWRLPHTRYYAGGGLFGLVLFVMFVHLSLTTSTPLNRSVITIDTTFTTELLREPAGHAYKQNQVREAVVAALSYQPDYVVLPEDSRLTTGFGSPEATTDFLSTYATDTIVVDSSRTFDAAGNTVLRAYTYDLARGNWHITDKTYLVPGGEFVPYLAQGLFHVFKDEETIATISRQLAYRPGRDPLDTTVPTDVPQLLFCSESVSPLLTRSRHQQRPADFTAHLVSHSWFHNPVILRNQLTAMLRVQAIWSGTPIVVAGNQTTGFLITKTGVLIPGKSIESSGAWKLTNYQI